MIPNNVEEHSKWLKSNLDSALQSGFSYSNMLVSEASTQKMFCYAFSSDPAVPFPVIEFKVQLFGASHHKPLQGRSITDFERDDSDLGRPSQKELNLTRMTPPNPSKGGRGNGVAQLD